MILSRFTPSLPTLDDQNVGGLLNGQTQKLETSYPSCYSEGCMAIGLVYNTIKVPVITARIFLGEILSIEGLYEILEGIDSVANSLKHF